MSNQDEATMIRVRAIRPFTQTGAGWSAQRGEGDRFKVAPSELDELLARGFIELLAEPSA